MRIVVSQQQAGKKVYHAKFDFKIRIKDLSFVLLAVAGSECTFEDVIPRQSNRFTWVRMSERENLRINMTYVKKMNEKYKKMNTFYGQGGIN